MFVGMLMTNIAMAQDKLITKEGHAKFYSHTAIEDIEANNYKVTSSLTPSTGKMVFSVPMQSFEFEKALMQKHFNSKKFLNTKAFPKAKFKGGIVDMSAIDMTKDGVYSVMVEGDLTIHGITQHVKEAGQITIKGGAIHSTSSFNITLADYEIAFKKGKPANNIAKSIEIQVAMDYGSM